MLVPHQILAPLLLISTTQAQFMHQYIWYGDSGRCTTPPTMVTITPMILLQRCLGIRCTTEVSSGTSITRMMNCGPMNETFISRAAYVKQSLTMVGATSYGYYKAGTCLPSNKNDSNTRAIFYDCMKQDAVMKRCNDVNCKSCPDTMITSGTTSSGGLSTTAGCVGSRASTSKTMANSAGSFATSVLGTVVYGCALWLSMVS